MKSKIWMGACAALMSVAPQIASAAAFADSMVVPYYLDSGGYHIGTNTPICGPTANAVLSCGPAAGISSTATFSGSPDGSLHASAVTQLTNYNVTLATPQPGAAQIGVLVYGQGALFDSVSFTGVTPTTLRFSYAVDGSVSTTAEDPTSSVAAGLLVGLGTNQAGVTSLQSTNPTWGGVATTLSQSVTKTGFFDVTVQGNAPVGFELILEAIDLLGSADGTNISGIVGANFQNTAHFGVEALDANGDDITQAAGLQFVAEQLPPTAAIPEPAAWAMILLGFGIAGSGLRNARRVRSKPAV